MPLLLIGLGILAGLALAARLQGHALPAATVKVGGLLEQEPMRPPIAYRGDRVAAIPQGRWGRVEHVMPRGNSYVYGIRLNSGRAVVLMENEVLK